MVQGIWCRQWQNGNDSNKERESFTIYDTAGKSWSCDNLNNGWYKTVITLKAVKGDHEKDIRIMKDNQISDDKSILLSMATAMRSIMTQAITMAPLGTLANYLVWIK